MYNKTVILFRQRTELGKKPRKFLSNLSSFVIDNNKERAIKNFYHRTTLELEQMLLTTCPNLHEYESRYEYYQELLTIEIKVTTKQEEKCNCCGHTICNYTTKEHILTFEMSPLVVNSVYSFEMPILTEGEQ